MGLEAAVSWLHLGLQLAALAPTTEEEEEEVGDGDTKHKGGQQGRNPPELTLTHSSRSWAQAELLNWAGSG